MKVIGYIRVSTDKQDLQRQKMQIEKYCDEHEYNLIRIIEEKISGNKGKENRIGLTELLDCNESDGDIVVISEMSRFSREDNLVRVVNNISCVLENGLSLVFLDKSDKIYKKGTTLSLEDTIILIASAFANAEERKKIVNRMFGRKCQLIEDVNPYSYMGGTPIFGFKVVSNPKYKRNSNENREPKSLIEEVPSQIEIIKELFKRSASGQTYKELSEYFNDARKVDTKSITVGQILTNEIYIGKRTYRGRKIEMSRKIIDEELFFKSISVHKINNKIFDKSYIHSNPLKGIIKCSCGASMVIENIKGNLVYACYKSKKHSSIESLRWCGNYGIRQTLVIDIINYDINNLKNEKEYDKKTVEKIKVIKKRIEQTKIEIKDAKKATKLIAINKDRITNLIINTNNLELQNRLEKQFIKFQQDESNMNNAGEKYLSELNELTKRLEMLCGNKIILVDVNDNQYGNYLRTIIDTVNYFANDGMKGYLFIHYKNNHTSGYAIKKGCKGYIIPINLSIYNFDNESRCLFDKEKNKLIDFREIVPYTDVILKESIKKFIPKTLNIK